MELGQQYGAPPHELLEWPAWSFSMLLGYGRQIGVLQEEAQGINPSGDEIAMFFGTEVVGDDDSAT